MQQIRRTVGTVGEWRRFLRTFAGDIVISENGNSMRIRRQHAIAAVVLEMSIFGRMPTIDVTEDRVVISVTEAPNFAPAW